MTTCRRPRGFWEDLFAEVEVEGSVVGVARRHGVNDRTLAWWCWKLRGERRWSAGEAEVPRLLPVVLRDHGLVSGAVSEIVVEWRDVRVRVAPGTDVGYVAALLEALRAC
jgi:transposase-like protein